MFLPPSSATARIAPTCKECSLFPTSAWVLRTQSFSHHRIGFWIGFFGEWNAPYKRRLILKEVALLRIVRWVDAILRVMYLKTWVMSGTANWLLLYGDAFFSWESTHYVLRFHRYFIRINEHKELTGGDQRKREGHQTALPDDGTHSSRSSLLRGRLNRTV